MDIFIWFLIVYFGLLGFLTLLMRVFLIWDDEVDKWHRAFIASATCGPCAIVFFAVSLVYLVFHLIIKHSVPPYIKKWNREGWQEFDEHMESLRRIDRAHSAWVEEYNRKYIQGK